MNDAEGRRAFLGALFREGGGSIRFDRWMQEPLYHPDLGYYTANIRDIGARGDFTTWPVFEDSLAAGMARWLQARRPPSGAWNVIEVGAGTGTLALAVLRQLGRWKAPHYHLVEISPVLRDRQKKRLRWRKASWHSDLKSALESVGGHAFLISNELVYAFPCRVFRRTAGGWEELFVGVQGGQAVERWQAAGDLPDSSAFDHDWNPGQRIEVQESFRQWIARWSPSWKSGAMLVIDYGATSPAVYRQRPQGTLRAYAHHQRLEGPGVLAAFGRRDITCDVNFSDVSRFASQAGIACHPPVTLGTFLAGTASGRLLEAGGAADQFQVMEGRPDFQQRG
ncbi:MAG: SAM-dependent methyltransferase [Terrimicrobiaceae bacterium]